MYGPYNIQDIQRISPGTVYTHLGPLEHPWNSICTPIQPQTLLYCPIWPYGPGLNPKITRAFLPSNIIVCLDKAQACFHWIPSNLYLNLFLKSVFKIVGLSGIFVKVIQKVFFFVRHKRDTLIS